MPGADATCGEAASPPVPRCGTGHVSQGKTGATAVGEFRRRLSFFSPFQIARGIARARCSLNHAVLNTLAREIAFGRASANIRLPSTSTLIEVNVGSGDVLFCPEQAPSQLM